MKAARMGNEERNVNARDMNTLGAALVAFRGMMQGAGKYIEQAGAMSTDGGREIVAEGWAAPAWAPPGRFVARDRMLEAGKGVLRRILDGWTAPDLEAVAAVELDDRDLDREVQQAWGRFKAAAGAVLVAHAVHGAPYPHPLDDGTAWRRCAPGAWPAEAAALVPDAQAALSAYAVLWLAEAARMDGASFLSRRAS